MKYRVPEKNHNIKNITFVVGGTHSSLASGLARLVVVVDGDVIGALPHFYIMEQLGTQCCGPHFCSLNEVCVNSVYPSQCSRKHSVVYT